MIKGPITSHRIIYKYLSSKPGSSEKVYYHDKFSTIAQLKAYFIRIPGAGPLVGYGKRESYHTWAMSASLLLEWTDQEGTHTVDFPDVFKFTEFLKVYPELAKLVEFEPKK